MPTLLKKETGVSKIYPVSFSLFKTYLYLCTQILHQEWRKAHQPAYSESLAAVVKGCELRTNCFIN